MNHPYAILASFAIALASTGIASAAGPSPKPSAMHGSMMHGSMKSGSMKGSMHVKPSPKPTHM